MGERNQSAGGGKEVSTAFIACSKTKRARSCRARDLYQGSLFKKALEYTTHHYQTVYILSAKYGMVELDQIIEPYEKTLKTMTQNDRKKWYEMVRRQMKRIGPPPPFTFYTGSLYCLPFDGIKPLSGLPLGRQLQWFDKRLQTKKPSTSFNLLGE